MAGNSYKVLGQTNPTSANTESILYTVPNGFMAFASVLSICNLGATTSTVRVAVRPAGITSTAKTFILYDTYINPNDSLMMTLGLSLATTDIVSVWSSTTSFSFVLSGSEIVVDTTNVQSVYNIATSSSVGMMRPDNTSVGVNNGVLSLIPGGSFTQATSSNYGAVRPDNTSILVTSGIISANIQVASSSNIGTVRPDGTSILVTSGVISANVNGDNTSILVNNGVLSVNSIFTGKQTFQGNTTAISIKISNALEGISVSSTAATGTINFDVTTQSILYFTSAAVGNWAINFRGNSSTSLNSLMAVGEALTVVHMVTNTVSPAFYNNSVIIDTSATVTTKWQGGSAPTAGNSNSVDSYSYTIVKTASATFTVFASQTRFA